MVQFKSILRQPTSWILWTAAASLLFNNWILALWLSPHLLRSGAEVSELSVSGEPGALVFQALDFVSGLMFIAAGAALYCSRGQADRLLKYSSYFVGLFGLANIADAVIRLPCSVTTDKNCALGISISTHGFHIPSHGISSVLIGVFYLVLPLSGVMYCHRRALYRNAFFIISAAAVADAAVSAARVALAVLTTQTVPVAGGGYTQELQMLIMASWFISGSIAVSLSA